MWLKASWLSVLVIGCGDFTSSSGELGMLNYGLHTTYELDGALTEVSLITRHSQSIHVDLSSTAEESIADPWEITHSASQTGISISSDDTDEGNTNPPGFDVIAIEPGYYTVESYHNDELLDRIELMFDVPLNIDVISWIRPGQDDTFSTSSTDQEVSIELGTQVAFLPIPLDPNGERLIGDFNVTYTVEPKSAAIRTHNVIEVYENEGVLGAPANDSLVFIETGKVTVTIADDLNGISTQRVFTVTDSPTTTAR